MDPKDVAVLEARNMKKYGNAVGPDVDWLVKNAMSKNPGLTEAQALELIIQSSYETSRWYNLLFWAF